MTWCAVGGVPDGDVEFTTKIAEDLDNCRVGPGVAGQPGDHRHVGVGW